MTKRIGRTLAEWEERAASDSAFRRIASGEDLLTNPMPPVFIRHVLASVRAVDEGRATPQQLYAEVSDALEIVLGRARRP